MTIDTPVINNQSMGSIADRPELSLPSIKRARDVPVLKEPQTVKR